jgi:hypothetical protein
VCIRAEISPHEQAELLQFLDKNSDAFAWSTFDFVGISREVIEHKLQVNPNANPKKQKLHKMSEEKIEAVKAEVQRLLEIYQRINIPQWLANVVKLVTNITSATIHKFLWQNIICRYGVPQQITIDNTKYFNSVIFKDFCHQIRTKVSFASVYHPQSNEAVERANALIFEAIKKILEGQKKGKWAEVMPRAVWSQNTTICRATNFTPFQLLFRAEAVLPEEIKHQSLRTTTEAPPCPNEVEEKDLLEPERLKAVTNLRRYQDETRNWRDPKVKKREFDVGNLVLLRSLM